MRPSGTCLSDFTARTSFMNSPLPANAVALPGNWLCFSAGFGSGQPGQNPYAAAPGTFGAPPPPRQSKWWLWLLLGAVGALLLLAVCCGGVAMWGMSTANSVIGQTLRDEVSDSPVVQEHLGDIESLSVNYTQSGEETQKRGGGNVLVVDTKGSKASGKLIVEQSRNPQPGSIFSKVDLRMPDGKEYSVK
jgi:hypothetical protein